MAIWNTKFDRINGETRVCKQCGNTYHTMKPIWICRLCTNEQQRKIQEKKRKSYGIKDNYPFSTKNHDAGKRFCKIRQKLRKAWDEGPEAVKKHYEAQLQEAEELGIMKWIYDRRDNETIKGKAEKSKKHIAKDWPDTRGYYEDL